MKQIVLTLGLAFVTFFGFSQSADITNAAMAYRDYESSMAEVPEKAVKSILKAKKHIDRAPVQTDSKNEAKRLMYLGKINIGLANGFALDNTAFAQFDLERTLEEGLAALKKSKEVDIKKRFVDDVDNYANRYRAFMANQGITAYGKEQYDVAMSSLLGAAEFGEVLEIKDSMYYFFGGQSALLMKEYKAAQKAFKECIALNYNTGESIGFLAKVLKEQGKMEEAEQELDAAAVLYPNNLDILIHSVNFYIDQNKNEKAEKAIAAAIKSAPDNSTLVFTSGIIYASMGRNDDAEKAYNRTLALDPKHTDAKYSLGVFFFNKGADANNEANAYDSNDPQYNTKYNAKMGESKGHFAKAVAYLERAAIEKPEDIQILEALKSAKAKAGMLD